MITFCFALEVHDLYEGQSSTAALKTSVGLTAAGPPQHRGSTHLIGNSLLFPPEMSLKTESRITSLSDRHSGGAL